MEQEKKEHHFSTPLPAFSVFILVQEDVLSTC